MILTVWNIRGLNDPCKVADVKQLLDRTAIKVLCLLETKVKQEKCCIIQKKIAHGLNWVCNYSVSGNGRIWLGWRSDRVHVEVITIHPQFIHCIVSNLDYSSQVAVSFVYGLHTIHDRKELWRGIRAVGLVTIPWLCTGDFNSVLHHADRINGSEITDYEVRDFRDFIDQLNFVEIKSKGSFFSWSNKAHIGPRTQTRIDRGLVNFEWLHQFPNVEAVYLPPSLSDHAPLFYEILPPDVGAQGNSMCRIWMKLKSLKAKLKDLNAKHFSNIDLRVDLAQQVVLDIQTQLNTDFQSSDLLAQGLLPFSSLNTGALQNLEALDLVTVRAGRQLTREAQNLLISPVTDAEIDSAINGISDDKAPGVDGFNSRFFKHSWDIVKFEVYEAVHEFFDKGSLYPQWNCTTLTLVPKVQNPSFVKDFRPIACCTVLYKTISKVLTARIARVIGEVVDEAQAGFIPGKHIGDNILLATELIKGYNHRHITPRCMIKVDLKKAYDSIEWSFLRSVMCELGFPTVFINWIMECISSISFSILINGSPTAPFKAKKGLRQGDPMSPFLFAIRMEYLSRCLHDLAKIPNFNFHPRCEKLLLTHLMFVDDLLLFSRADECSIKLLFQAFQKFSKASGLVANLSKSEVYFGGITTELQKDFLDCLGMTAGSLPFKYLGVPLSSMKLTIQQCKPLYFWFPALLSKQSTSLSSIHSKFLMHHFRTKRITAKKNKKNHHTTEWHNSAAHQHLLTKYPRI
ncbi:uncharacterized protein LOC110682631 [Chenopodium quinoa]|uniref:uncharacterized protein LOC110682631 n=1 Tax=Chenopodium quinoa TaxID=63459 RepID=UPI000B781C03|nr:uncharacterized protein LOC110682631 [Chenopodium quinoa]